MVYIPHLLVDQWIIWWLYRRATYSYWSSGYFGFKFVPFCTLFSLCLHFLPCYSTVSCVLLQTTKIYHCPMEYESCCLVNTENHKDLFKLGLPLSMWHTGWHLNPVYVLGPPGGSTPSVITFTNNTKPFLPVCICLFIHYSLEPFQSYCQIITCHHVTVYIMAVISPPHLFFLKHSTLLPTPILKLDITEKEPWGSPVFLHPNHSFSES